MKINVLIKKLIRLIFKICATPAILLFIGVTIVTSYIMSAIYWIYDANKWDIEANQMARKDMLAMLKEWFTTL